MSSDLEEQTQTAISKVVKLSKITTDNYPSGSDYSYFSSYPSFTEQSNKISNDVLTLLNKLCNFVNPNNNNNNNNNNDNIDLISENNEYLRWQSISESADYCCEQVDICLDQIKEFDDNQSLLTSNTNITKKINRLFAGEINDNNSLETLYPQQSFIDDIDNSRDNPFKPNLISERKLTLIDNNYYLNPFENEIKNIKNGDKQLNYREETFYYSINNTPLYWIDTVNKLEDMCSMLSYCSEIAVDVEHHNKYTFQGITCLIQISTRNKDYIIDTLLLKQSIHKYLNPIFTNASIIKVFHGCNNDILWLQRDFSIYVVNIFDTHQAALLLGLKQKSLKYLLKMYCNVNVNKELRLSDWRIRPLREELINYAREDTHYLLYIFDCLNNLLLQKSSTNNNLLVECYNNSNKLALQVYHKPVFNSNGWMKLCQINGWYFINNISLNVLSKLYEWRDRIGRELDQSVSVVLSNYLLKIICKCLPKNKNELLNDKKYKSLSIIAKKYYKDILDIINESVNDKTVINTMFEATTNSNDNDNDVKMNSKDDGCINNDEMNNNFEFKLDKITQLDMIASNDNNSLFFPVKNDQNIQISSTQKVVNQIFNDIANESLIQIIKQKTNNNINVNKLKKKKKVNNNVVRNNKKNKNKNNNSKKQKLKHNNIDRVATPIDRSKIFGSRYLDRNSKKDVFKLPRNKNKNKKNKNKKRKTDNNDIKSLSESIQPFRKKRKLSKYNQIQETLKDKKQNKRMKQTMNVQNEWPFYQSKTKNKNKKIKNKNKNKNQSNTNSNNNDNNKNDDNDIDMTVNDILDAAPVPVLDNKFDAVYDPFNED